MYWRSIDEEAGKDGKSEKSTLVEGTKPCTFLLSYFDIELFIIL